MANLQAFIGLGSNRSLAIGNSHTIDPQQIFAKALTMLDSSRHIEVVAMSSVHSTAPMYYEQQDKFSNAVVELKVSCNAHVLLARLISIETYCGRDRSNEIDKGPRTLDLDLLWHQAGPVDTPNLTVPHPGISERRFVLAPWSELAPNLVIQPVNRSVSDLLSDLA